MNDQIKNRLAITIMTALKPILARVADSLLIRIGWKDGDRNNCVFVFGTSNKKDEADKSVRDVLVNGPADVRQWADRIAFDDIRSEPTWVPIGRLNDKK